MGFLINFKTQAASVFKIFGKFPRRNFHRHKKQKCFRSSLNSAKHIKRTMSLKHVQCKRPKTHFQFIKIKLLLTTQAGNIFREPVLDEPLHKLEAFRHYSKKKLTYICCILNFKKTCKRTENINRAQNDSMYGKWQPLLDILAKLLLMLIQDTVLRLML